MIFCSLGLSEYKWVYRALHRSIKAKFRRRLKIRIAVADLVAEGCSLNQPSAVSHCNWGDFYLEAQTPFASFLDDTKAIGKLKLF